MNWSVIIGIFGTLAGFALSYLAFARNSKKDSTDAGKESGTVLTEIGYIKANTDDIKRKQEKQDETLVKMTAALAAAWEFAKGYLSFSKLLCYGVLLIDYKTTSTTLDLCYIAVANNYTGSLPYLTALIALLQAATATVLSFALNKSKAENTAGGIVYETTLKRDC